MDSWDVARGGLPGRERELAELDLHLDAVTRSAGRMVLLEGPAGIGKSTLLSAMRPMASERGVRWLAARGSELERDFPFGIVRQLLEPAVAIDPSLLTGPAALAGSALGVPGADPASEPGYGLLHGLFWLVSGLAEQGPLVLCVDDLQWADGPSLRLLDHLALRLDGLPVLCALAARSGDATLSVGPIARLVAHPDVHSLVVGSLAPEAVAAILFDELGAEPSPALLLACTEVTGGNAFLVREVAGELRRSGTGVDADPDVVRELAPPSIVRSLRLRLESLDPDAVALAQAVAVLGGNCDVPVAADLAGLPHARALAAAEMLEREAILEPGRPLRFVHSVVRTAARETLGAVRREELHRGAAATAAQRGEPDVAAGHLLAVDPAGDPTVAGTLLRAAEDAQRRGAPDVALTFLRRALAEPPADAEVPVIAIAAAQCAATAGDPAALALAERALQTSTTPEQQLAAAREAAVIHVSAGRHEQATEIMAAALAAPGLPLQARMAGEGLLLISATIAAGPRRAQAERLEQARALGEQAPAAMVVVHGFERVLVDGDVAGGADLLERTVAGGRLLAEVAPGSPFPFIAANGLIVAGRYATAEAFVNSVIADAAARGSLWAFVLATAQRGLLRLRQGRIEAAAADAQASLDNREGQTPVQVCVASAALAGARLAMGDIAGARAVLAQVDDTGARPDTHIGVVVQESRARVALAEHRWDAVLDATAACAEWEREFEVSSGGWPTWRGYAASAHAALGDLERARALAAEGVVLARAYGVPRTLGLSLRGAGLVEAGPPAIGLLEESVMVLEGGGLRAEAAGALTDLGAALAAADRVDEARMALDRALATAEASGARGIETLARDALVKLGARPRRRSVMGSTALTPAERRVAELAAGGASNRDVAEGLFLTPKTVENHLTNVYRKLGIASRSQLADHLA